MIEIVVYAGGKRTRGLLHSDGTRSIWCELHGIWYAGTCPLCDHAKGYETRALHGNPLRKRR